MQPAGNSAPQAAYILDSFAMLAYLLAEPEGGRVRELIRAAADGECRLYMCVINLGEVAYIEECERGLAHAEDVLALIRELPIEVVDADRNLTLAAAHLKMDCPIAYADCFAAALAQTRNATVLTGDPEFQKIGPECNVLIEWLADRVE